MTLVYDTLETKSISNYMLASLIPYTTSGNYSAALGMTHILDYQK